MFELLAKLLSFWENEPQDYEEKLLHAAIEAVVDGTDPRLRVLSNYQHLLRRPTQNAIHYVRQLVSHLGDPLDLTRASFASDPRVHLLFGRADAIGELCQRNTALQNLKQQQPDNALFYAVLMAKREEKRVLGMQMMGEVLQNDVPQTVLNFRDHRLLAVAASPKECRNQIKRSAFLYVVQRALATVTALKNHDNELAAQLLKERYHALSQLHRSPEQGVWPEPEVTHDQDADQKLSALDQRLRQCQPLSCSLDDYLQVVAEVVGHPERVLWQHHYSGVVDRMGVVLSARDAQQVGADQVTIPEVCMPEYATPIVSLLVQIARQDIPEPQVMCLDKAIY